MGKTNLVIFELLFTPNPGGTRVYDSKNDAEDNDATRSASRSLNSYTGAIRQRAFNDDNSRPVIHNQSYNPNHFESQG